MGVEEMTPLSRLLLTGGRGWLGSGRGMQETEMSREAIAGEAETEAKAQRERERGGGSDIVTRGGHVSRPLSVSLDRGDVAVDDPGHDCLGALSTGKRSTSIVLCEACSGFDRRI
ncbi:hypothetical protein GW17_00016431 [Ensete ventricosum]|nr:hypothetical protein GW17_00016431 [Ensete ventricosum]